MTEIKQLAEEHWRFIEELLTAYRGSLELNGIKPNTVSLECCHYLYVQAMVHGYKHALEQTTCKINGEHTLIDCGKYHLKRAEEK